MEFTYLQGFHIEIGETGLRGIRIREGVPLVLVGKANVVGATINLSKYSISAIVWFSVTHF